LSQKPSHKWVSRQTLAWLLVAQGFSIAPLFVFLPLWIPVLWFVTLIWRVQIYRGAWPFPSSKIKFLIGALSILGLVASFFGKIGVEPLVAFLVVSFVLKLVEVRSAKDVLLIIYIGFIAIAVQFLFFQSFMMAVYGCFAFVLMLSAWNSVYRTRAFSLKHLLKSNVGLFVKCLPVMFILFIMMPRLGSLWHVPIPRSTGTTGFSEDMSPGDISNLSQSRAVAFRVTFSDATKPSDILGHSDLYWRGLVLDQFDGRRWRNARSRFVDPIQSGLRAPESWGLATVADGPSLDYEVLLEPHQQRWLFTLMAPLKVYSNNFRLGFTGDYLAKSDKPIASRTQYSVRSTTSYQAAPDALPVSLRRRNLLLPPGRNMRTQDLVADWLAEGLDEQAIVARALSFYRDAFTYTLRPPPLGSDSVDEFLFISKRGFCEHFASAFVVMMRSAGIPARVVVGYQGGELNPVENYLIVRQSDAHAWAEVWFEGAGWLRVDPTAAVSPARIERGLADSLAGDERQLVGQMLTGSWLNLMQLRVDAMSYSWHRWVLGYDEQKQSGLLGDLLGGTDVWRLALGFLSAITLLLGGYFAWFLWGTRVVYGSESQALYYRYLKKLSKKGYVPLAGETPLGFAERVSKLEPSWGQDISHIARLYHHIAYASDDTSLHLLRRKVKSLRLNSPR